MMTWGRYIYGNEFLIPGMWWGIFLPLAILDLILRGLALYRSARRGQNAWFIALLVVNSMGILPAIYLLTNKEKTSKK